MSPKQEEKIFGEKIKNFSTPTLKALLCFLKTEEDYLRLTDMIMDGKSESEVVAELKKMGWEHPSGD